MHEESRKKNGNMKLQERVWKMMNGKLVDGKKKKASRTWAVTWKEPSPMLAMTLFFPFRAWAYPSVAPTDQPIDPNCIWNSYLQFDTTSS